MVEINRQLPQTSEVFYRLNVGAKLSRSRLSEAFKEILDYPNNKVRDVLMGAFLTSIMLNQPRVIDVVTLLDCAFAIDSYSPKNAIKIEIPGNKKLIGTVGSGKKGVKTINISTPSSIIAACVGAFVAKTGSSSTSSTTGSADFMDQVGLNYIENKSMVDILKKTGFGFFSIEKLIPKFDKIYGGKFFAPHVLSFGLAALVTPVKFDSILFGLAHPNVEFAIKVLKKYGLENAMVVSSSHDDVHFLDEIGIFGTTRLIGMKQGKIGRLRYFLPTEELGLPRYSPKSIAQSPNVSQNVKYSINVLKGKGILAHEDIICINAANILYLSDLAENLIEGFYKAKLVVRKGLPFEKLQEIIKLSGGNMKKFHRFG